MDILSSDSADDLAVDALVPVTGAFFTVFVDTPLFSDDRELSRLFLELLFCTGMIFLAASPESESFFLKEFCLNGRLGRLQGVPALARVADALRS